jgi:hypothetical protein
MGRFAWDLNPIFEITTIHRELQRISVNFSVCCGKSSEIARCNKWAYESLFTARRKKTELFLTVSADYKKYM